MNASARNEQPDANKTQRTAGPSRTRWTAWGAVWLVSLGTALVGSLAGTTRPVSLTVMSQWPGYVRGFPSDVAIQGPYAYVAATRAGLLVVDVTNPSDPVTVGSSGTGGGSRFAGWRLAVSGDYAYLAGVPFPASDPNVTVRLQVIDVSDPAFPRKVGECPVGPGYIVSGVVVQGSYVYLISSEGLSVVDVSQPSNAGVQVFDVSNPADPVLAGAYSTADQPSAIAAAGGFVYVGLGESGLLILRRSVLPPPAEWVRVQTEPASTPRARLQHAMVYDEERGVVFMHGGLPGNGTVLSDTWQWDGGAWALLATNGPKVFQQSMTYDPSRGVTVLYGGRTAAGHANPIADTWEWDGRAWNLIEVGPTAPPPPIIGGMGYDPVRRKVLRHGGVTAPNDTFDVGTTWEWNGQTWTQIADGFIRGAHSLFYDTLRGKMLAFGGSSSSNVSPSPGTWAFDGDQWNLITTSGPSPRFTFNRTLVWDSNREVGVLYGSGPSPSEWFDDTWEWDGAVWRKVNVSGPGPRAMHAMAYDARRGKVVLFGGYRDCFRCEINETWEYGLAPLQVSRIERLPDNSMAIRWSGEAPPYQVQSCSSLAALDWRNESEPTDRLNATVNTGESTRFFRVLSLFGSERR